MTEVELNAFADAVIKTIRQALDTRCGPIEADIAALKARPLQKWAGIHVDGVQYSEASLVTKGGSLWVATTTTITPGESGGDWRLIVKRGHAL